MARSEWVRRAPARRLTYLLGEHFGVFFGVHGASITTAMRSLLTRVFVSKHRPDGVVGRPIRPKYETVLALFKPFEDAHRERVSFVTPISMEEFVEGAGRKKRVYENALRTYEERGLRSRDSRIDMFVKAEKLNLTKKTDPDPRAIQPRGVVYNLCVGVYIKVLESVIYRNIAKVFGDTTVFKGMNALQQGEVMQRKWHRFADPVAFGLDLHRMDQHVSYECLRWEHKQYDMYFHSARLRRLLAKQLVNVGSCRTHDGSLRYSVKGCRMSGDMNTALGNCLIMCAALYSAYADLGIKYELCNNGDDCVVMCERQDAEHLKERAVSYLARLGLPLGAEETVDKLEHVDFCQTHPVFDGTRWTMVRDPRVVLSKDSCSLKTIRGEADWNTIRNTIGLSGLALAGHMPVFCEFYEALRRGAGERVDKDTTPTGFTMLAKGMNMSGVMVTPEARCSFFTAFNITPDEQVALESYFKRIEPVWCAPLPLTAVDVNSTVASAMGLQC